MIIISPKSLHSYILTLFFLIVSNFVFAQGRKPDVMVKKDNSKIEGVIQEFSSTTIKYKKVSDPSGPTFTIDKSELKTILYGNGDIDELVKSSATPAVIDKDGDVAVPTKMSKNDFINLVHSADSEHLKNLKTGYKQRASKKMIGGIVATVFSIGAFVGGVLLIQDANYYQDDEPAERPVGYGCLVLGSGFSTLAILSFIKGGRFKSRVALVEQELRKRNEPFSNISLYPTYSFTHRSPSLILRLTF